VTAAQGAAISAQQADDAAGTAQGYQQQAQAWAGQASTTAAGLSGLLSTSIVMRPMAAESGYLFAALDGNQRAAFAVGTDGSFTAFSYAAGTVPGAALTASAVTTQKLSDGAVTAAKLDTASVGQYLPKVLAPESGYVWGLVDAGNRLAMGVRTDGSFAAGKMTVPAQSVDFTQLTANLSSYVARTLSPESGYVWGVLDAAGRIGLGVATDGTVVGKVSGLLSAGSVTAGYIAIGAVGEAKLDGPVQRLAMPHAGDVVEVMPDAWRGQYGTVAVRTSTEGTGWRRFPGLVTRTLRGKNLSGTAIQFRRSAGLMFRGLRDGGAWTPTANAAVASGHFIGTLAAGFTTPSTSGRTAGDYYRVIGTASATAFDGQSLLCGDLVVFDGSAWRAQLAPRYGAGPVAPQNNRLEGDFWTVSAAGTFDGISYAAGDRIVHVGFDSLSGSGAALWAQGKAGAGELFYRGEFAPGTGSLPASPAQGDVYQASAAGTDTTTGLSFAVADYAVFDHYSTWGRVASDTITTVPANAMIPALACVANAYEWEVRRADKSAAVVGVAPTVLHQSSPRRSADTILLLSDSMFGVPNIQGQLSSLVAPRAVNLVSRGGGTSRNVMSTYEWYVATQGDPYAGDFTFIWQGQNNQPGAVGDAAWCQILETALELRGLLGARDRRFCFLSILGIDAMTFDGTRIHVTQHEAMNQGASQGHVLWQLEQWYGAMFPNQWLSPRQALVAAAQAPGIPAASILDARLPGSGYSEAQTAQAYGWIPLSWWNPPSGGWPVALNSLNLKGYWTSNSLPSGGATGDCYTVASGTLGNVGALIINTGGTWSVNYADQTHLGAGANQGGQYLAAALAGFLSSRLV